MEPTRSFRLERGSSIRLGRSYSSVLVPDSITSDCDRITGYKRLSQSMRASINENENEYEYDTIDDTTTRNNKKKTWGILRRVFSSRKRDDEAEKVKMKMKMKKKSKWSSWLPDSEKRWPVQGW